ncbi:hypothetical protein VB780_26405 [Leptolyngbya sp. CCNP1308]|uniref:hypothetical protein n=1 Tax=Leptolyngbya sp. CCNP1308 TaxID=3110255 RepID=UPI002B217D8B|nr:hypothetical protein [Leptolyngbya sp. CCNP1308]MEA5452134.1 hypothetical protein [Leptolyngbya sp. CCNP1308]
MALLVLAQQSQPFVEFTPAQAKQAVARELGLERIPRPDDAADGLALALAAWYQR